MPSQEPESEPSILIIGAGTFGTSTAHHLSKTYTDPSRITLLDRWDPDAATLPEKPAASIDTNRIIRTDYSSRLYCNLANSALHFWFWNIAVQGLFRKTGWVVVDRKGNGFSDSVRKCFGERGGDVTREVDVKGELEGRFPGILGGAFGKAESTNEQVEGGDEDGVEYGNAYFNPEAGWCDAEKATASFTRVALNNGVKRVTATVESLLFDAEAGRLEGVRTTKGSVIRADKIVLATGAWTSALLSPLEDILKIPHQDRIERQITAVGRVSAYYTLPASEVATLTDSSSIEGGKFPVIVLGNEIDIIPPSPQNLTLKINDLRTEVVHTITTPTGRKISTPHPSPQNTNIPKPLTRKTDELIRRILPAFAKSHPKPTRYRVCYDAVTPTEDWLVSRHPHPKLENLTVAVGGSFHSYKFLPVAGEFVANVVMGKGNGEEKDGAWGWKSKEELERGDVGGKEFGESGRRGRGERLEFGDFVEEKAKL